MWTSVSFLLPRSLTRQIPDIGAFFPKLAFSSEFLAMSVSPNSYSEFLVPTFISAEATSEATLVSPICSARLRYSKAGLEILQDRAVGVNRWCAEGNMRFYEGI